MQDVIKKYFWIIGVIAVLTCSALAAKAANHLIAGKYLNDSADPTKIDKPITKKPSDADETRSKDGAPVATRNMFCSTCQPEEPVKQPVEEPGDPNVVPLTSLPLKLLATSVSTRAEYSFATIVNTESQSQGAYWVDNVIPSGGPVVKISPKYVDFHNDASSRVERISLLDEGPVARTAKPTSEPTVASNAPKDELTAMLDEGIKKTGENSYEVDRALIDKVLSDPMSVARGARIVPSIKDGKSDGFKLYAIRPSSVFAKIGLRNGDTINAINGFELTTPDKALEVYTKVKESSNVAVSVTRRGQTVNLDYSIR